MPLCASFCVLHIMVVHDVGCYVQQQAWIHLDNDTKTYLPTVFFNDFWTLRDYMVSCPARQCAYHQFSNFRQHYSSMLL